MNNVGLVSQQQRNEKLQHAAWEGNLQAVALWHKAGAQIGADYNRATKFATHAGSEECLQYLVNNGARPNERLLSTRDRIYHPYDTCSSLAIAGGMGHTGLIDMLSKPAVGEHEPIDKWEPDFNQSVQAFVFAVSEGHKSTIRHLLENHRDKISLKAISNADHYAKTDEIKQFVKPFAESAREELSAQELAEFDKRFGNQRTGHQHLKMEPY